MSKFILPEITVDKRKEKSAVTLMNRGGLKFLGTKMPNGDIVFDTENYVDPRTEFTTEKVASQLKASEIKLAQEELIEVATNMGATFLDKKTKE